jgi:hypothetical protein
MTVSLGRLMFCLSVSDEFSRLLLSSLTETYNTKPCGLAVSRLHYLDNDLSMSFSFFYITIRVFFLSIVVIKPRPFVFYNEYSLHLSSTNIHAYNIDDNNDYFCLLQDE